MSGKCVQTQFSVPSKCSSIDYSFIGTENIKLWNEVKAKLACPSNEIFIKKLLEIAIKYCFENNIRIKDEKLEDNDHDTALHPLVSQNDEVPHDTTSPDVSEKLSKKRMKKAKTFSLDSRKTFSDTVANRICIHCNVTHNIKRCVIENPLHFIADGRGDSMKNAKSFAENSLPKVLSVAPPSSAENELGIFSKGLIKCYTQFGPILGKVVRESDVPEDCDMRFLHQLASLCAETADITVDDNDEHQQAASTNYVCLEDEAESNWCRWLRPAQSRKLRNVTVVEKYAKLYLVTTCDIRAGDELLYWRDFSLGNIGKKQLERTVCGGCNITFSHALFYRTHCSIFHDLRYSLTIRKYHCKVCSAAVLGKENIIKHAVDKHNGQGAYQCQFCDRFFLRLNYLEMHRTYGCSQNPDRTRPLCDFCGRKFCQPQKLKMHIKRMHSDMTETLNDFKCKNCDKLLGSRAAVQRHMKEVHEKPVTTAQNTCRICGKAFQNKSNLKIHMLTHSGVKPFSCAETECAAAFTTKQCLQFHYKKVHGYNEDKMPKINRTVDYTFEAYSGNDNDEPAPSSDECGQHTSGEYDGTAIDDKRRLTSESEIDCEQSDDLCKTDIYHNDNHFATKMHSPPPTSFTLHAPPPSHVTTDPPVVTMKVLSKASKKWMGDDTSNLTLNSVVYSSNHSVMGDYNNCGPHSHDVEHMVDSKAALTKTVLEVTSNSMTANRLLVEAALDSVCVNTVSGVDDAHVQRLGVVGTPPTLPDIDPVATSVDIATVNDHDVVDHDDEDEEDDDDGVGNLYATMDGGDFHGEDHISVTDDHQQQHQQQHHLHDKLQDSSGASMGDYFSPSVSPVLQQGMNDYDHHHHSAIIPVSQHDVPLSDYDSKLTTAQHMGTSPYSKYYGTTTTVADEFSVVDGYEKSLAAAMAKEKDTLQLDLFLYKTPYGGLDLMGPLRKYDMDKPVLQQQHGLGSGPLDLDLNDSNLLRTDKPATSTYDLPVTSAAAVATMLDPTSRVKMDLDFELRAKTTYESLEEIRNRLTYETFEDFRLKNYELTDASTVMANYLDPPTIPQTQPSTTDRTQGAGSYEPLVLTAAAAAAVAAAREMQQQHQTHQHQQEQQQGVDMSSRSSIYGVATTATGGTASSMVGGGSGFTRYHPPPPHHMHHHHMYASAVTAAAAAANAVEDRNATVDLRMSYSNYATGTTSSPPPTLPAAPSSPAPPLPVMPTPAPYGASTTSDLMRAAAAAAVSMDLSSAAAAAAAAASVDLSLRTGGHHHHHHHIPPHHPHAHHHPHHHHHHAAAAAALMHHHHHQYAHHHMAATGDSVAVASSSFVPAQSSTRLALDVASTGGSAAAAQTPVQRPDSHRFEPPGSDKSRSLLLGSPPPTSSILQPHHLHHHHLQQQHLSLSPPQSPHNRRLSLQQQQQQHVDTDDGGQSSIPAQQHLDDALSTSLNRNSDSPLLRLSDGTMPPVSSLSVSGNNSAMMSAAGIVTNSGGGTTYHMPYGQMGVPCGSPTTITTAAATSAVSAFGTLPPPSSRVLGASGGTSPTSFHHYSSSYY